MDDGDSSPEPTAPDAASGAARPDPGTRRRAIRYVGMGLVVLAFVAMLLPALEYLVGDPMRDYDEVVLEFAPPAEVAFVQSYVALLRAGDYESFYVALSPEMRAQATRPLFDQLRGQFPSGEPSEVKTIAAHTHVFERVDSRSEQVALTLLYEFPARSVTAEVVTRSEGGVKQVIGVHVNWYRQSPSELFRPGNADTGLLHYVVLLLVIAIPLFMVATALVCIREAKSAKELWLWLPFILLSATKTELDWTAGAMRSQWLAVHLYGAGFKQPSPYAPLVIFFGIPVGAIGFWGARRRRRRADALRASGVVLELPQLAGAQAPTTPAGAFADVQRVLSGELRVALSAASGRAALRVVDDSSGYDLRASPAGLEICGARDFGRSTPLLPEIAAPLLSFLLDWAGTKEVGDSAYAVLEPARAPDSDHAPAPPATPRALWVVRDTLEVHVCLRQTVPDGASPPLPERYLRVPKWREGDALACPYCGYESTRFRDLGDALACPQCGRSFEPEAD